LADGEGKVKRHKVEAVDSPVAKLQARLSEAVSWWLKPAQVKVRLRGGERVFDLTGVPEGVAVEVLDSMAAALRK
jgi:hypothetical protein